MAKKKRVKSNKAAKPAGRPSAKQTAKKVSPSASQSAPRSSTTSSQASAQSSASQPINYASDFERMEARFGASKSKQAPKQAPQQAPQQAPPAQQTAPKQEQAAGQSAAPRKRRRRRFPWQKKRKQSPNPAHSPEKVRQMSNRKPSRRPRKRKLRKVKKRRPSWWERRRMRIYTPAQRRAQARLQRHRLTKWGKLFTTLLTLFCVMLSVVQFFTVREIVMVGVTKYDSGLVTQTFGIEEGENLFFSDTRSGVTAMYAAYPYFSDISVRIQLPETLIVTVEETSPAAAVITEDESWYLVDEHVRALEKTKHIEDINLPTIGGIIAASDVPLGEALPDDETGKIAALRDIMEVLRDEDLIERVGMINLNAMYDICFSLDERLVVRVGDGSDLAYKLRWLPILEDGRIGSNDYAVIDLSDTAQASVLISTADELAEMLVSEGDAEETVITPDQLMGLEEILLDENGEPLEDDASSEEVE